MPEGPKSHMRFGIIWEGVGYNIFGLLVLNDESLALISYQQGQTTEVGQQRLGSPIAKRFRGEVDLSSVPSRPLQHHKFTFHRSGFFHATDKAGQRVPEYDGMRGMAFADIVDCWTLFSLYPTVPTDYRVRGRAGKNAQIVDIATYGFVPLQVTVYLSKAGFDFDPVAERLNSRYASLFLRAQNLLPNHGLHGIIRFHRSSTQVFPTHESLLFFRLEQDSA